MSNEEYALARNLRVLGHHNTQGIGAMKRSAIAIAAFIAAGAASITHAIPVTVDPGDLVTGKELAGLAPGARKSITQKLGAAGGVGSKLRVDSVGADQTAIEGVLVGFSNPTVGSLKSSSTLHLTMSGAQITDGFSAATNGSRKKHPRDDKHVTSPAKERILRVVNVPEPASLMLYGLGLAGIGVARRRRAKRP